MSKGCKFGNFTARLKGPTYVGYFRHKGTYCGYCGPGYSGGGGAKNAQDGNTNCTATACAADQRRVSWPAPGHPFQYAKQLRSYQMPNVAADGIMYDQTAFSGEFGAWPTSWNMYPFGSPRHSAEFLKCEDCPAGTWNPGSEGELVGGPNLPRFPYTYIKI